MNEIFERRFRQAIKESVSTVAEYAGDHHRFIARTGNLERSITPEVMGLRGVIYLDDKLAPYGPMVHEGTRPHVILPKNRKVLRWADGGEFIFARKVQHPGTKPDQFLYQALDANENRIMEIFDRYAELAKEDIAEELVK